MLLCLQLIHYAFSIPMESLENAHLKNMQSVSKLQCISPSFSALEWLGDLQCTTSSSFSARIPDYQLEWLGSTRHEALVHSGICFPREDPGSFTSLKPILETLGSHPKLFAMQYTPNILDCSLDIPDLVAVKSFQLDDLSFENEMKVASRLGNASPYVIKTYAFFKTLETQNIVMEFGGMDLFEYVFTLKKLAWITSSESNSRFLLMQIVLAVEAMHSKGLIHHDLKVENFIFGADGSSFLRLIDFGHASDIENSRGVDGYASWNLSYRSPEIIRTLLYPRRGTSVGFASDWFSVGHIFHVIILLIAAIYVRNLSV